MMDDDDDGDGDDDDDDDDDDGWLMMNDAILTCSRKLAVKPA